MVNERTEERLKHIETVLRSLDRTQVVAVCVAVTIEALDDAHCDVCRLVAIQQICSQSALDLLDHYKKAKQHASRN